MMTTYKEDDNDDDAEDDQDGQRDDQQTEHHADERRVSESRQSWVRTGQNLRRSRNCWRRSHIDP